MKDAKLSSREWELISAYIDGELNAQEKARLEERIKISPEYQQAIEGLRRTKAILQKAPVRKVPRNFTLTQADVQPARLPRWIPTMQWASAAVALVAGFLFASQMIPGFVSQKTNAPAAMESAAPTQSPLAETAPQPMAADQTAPEVIYWGGAPMLSGAVGMGGGGGGAPDCSSAGAMCGGGAGVGGGIDAPATEMPFPQPPIPNSLPDLQVGTTAKISAAPSESVTGTGPVLGVRSTGEQGKILEETQIDVQEVSGLARETKSPQTSTLLLAAAGVLFAAALVLFVGGVIARRKIQH